jgi:general secretion pathway protein G
MPDEGGTRIALLFAMDSGRHSASRGFSLIELLIVVAIIGLVSAIAVPNLLNAIQRGRQARTVGDVRTISNALGMYLQDFMLYPIASSWVTFGSIRSHLLLYKGNLNELDGWRKQYMYISDGHDYTLVSYGMNGVADLPWTGGRTSTFEDDIVVQGGALIQWPEGLQH